MATAYEYVVDIRAGFAKLSGDINGVTNQFKRLERDVGSIFSNIGKIATAGLAIAGVAAIGKLNTALVEMAKRGEAAGSIMEGFQKLGGSTAAIKQAQQATIGLVSSFDLMKIANQAMLKGVPDVNKNFGLLAEYAGRVANTLDQDTTVALSNLVNALASTKEKQLQAMGVTIDADKAYRDFAKANNIAAIAGKRWEDVLTSQQQKLAKQSAVVQAVIDKTGKLAPVTDSVANAQAAFTTALADGDKQMSIAVNNSEGLRTAYRELEQATKSIDWAALGKAIGEVASVIATLASTVIPPAVSAFNDLSKAAAFFFSNDARSEMERTIVSVGEMGEQLKKAQDNLKREQARGGWKNDLVIASLTKEIEDLKAKLPEASKKVLELYKVVSNEGKSVDTPIKETNKGLSDMPGKAEAAAKAVAKVTAEIAKQATANKQEGIQRGLENALDKLDIKAFQTYLESLRTQTRDGILAGYKEAWSSLSKDKKAEAQTGADDAANLATDEYKKKWNDAAEKFGKAQQEASAEAAKKTAEEYNKVADGIRDSFRAAFDQAANGDWKTSLMDLAANFAAAIGAAFTTGVTKNPDVITGLADLGKVFGNVLANALGIATGGEGSPGSGGAGAGAGIGKVAAAAGQSYFNDKGELVKQVADVFVDANKQAVVPPNGAIGQNQDGTFIMPDGSSQKGAVDAQRAEQAAQNAASYAAAAGTILGAATRKPSRKDNAAEGQAAGAAIGAVIGAYYGNPAAGAAIGGEIGRMIGSIFKKGVQHPDSKARVAFEGWIEDQFKALGKVRFIDANGKLGGYFKDFKGKSFQEDFNNSNGGDWSKNMDAWGSKAKSTFLGLGEAMKELRGITEDVGAQIGYMLGQNMAGNIDNARALVQALGLTFEQVSEALLKSAMKGTISWLAFNSYIRDTAEAFKPGLAAIGAIDQAFQNLIDGAGQGRESVKAFKDIAVEAMEAGVTTMEQLRQYLLSKGFDPEYVNALINSAINRGIDTLKEWSEASDAAAGSVVGDMEAASGKLQEEWNKMRESLKGLSESLKEIPKEVNTTVKIKVKTEYDEATKEVVKKLGQGALPGAVPNEGERNLSEDFTTPIGRSGTNSPQAASAAGRVLAARMRSQNPFTWNGNATLGPVAVPAPAVTGTPYQWGAGGLNNKGNPNLPDNTPLARRPGTTNINIDAKGAGAGVERQIIDAANYVEQKVMRTILGHITQTQARGGRAADNY